MTSKRFRYGPDDPVDCERLNFRSTKKQFATWQMAFERAKKKGEFATRSDWIRAALDRMAAEYLR